MKKRIIALVSLIAVMLACVPGFAVHTECEHTECGHKEGEIEVFFEEDIDEALKKRITASFTGEEPEVQPLSILCIFGHNLSTHQAASISHKVYAAAPRCQQNTYLITACSRCDYLEREWLNSIRIHCCS